MQVGRTWKVFGPILIALVTYDLAIATVVEGLRSDAAHFIVIGVMSAQMTRIAVWTAWGPVSLFIRTSSGFTLAAAGIGSPA